MNYDAIKKAAEGYRADMAKFLRDMIAIPSESCEEEGVVKRIAAEMEKLGYDKVEFDKLGNVIGWMGTGDKIIAIDSHIDTVGIGNRENWTADPYTGYETDEIIYGRGGSDQEGGMASATYGAKIMKDLNLIPGSPLSTNTLTAPRTHAARSSSSSPPSRPTAASTAAIAAEWRSASICTAFPATAPLRSAATTRSTRWLRSS